MFSILRMVRLLLKVRHHQKLGNSSLEPETKGTGYLVHIASIRSAGTPGGQGLRGTSLTLSSFSARHLTWMSPLFHSSRPCRASSFDVDSWRSQGVDSPVSADVLNPPGIPHGFPDPRSVQMMRSSQGSPSPVSSGSWMVTSSSGGAVDQNGGMGCMLPTSSNKIHGHPKTLIVCWWNSEDEEHCMI